MAATRVRCPFEFRNGDGNYLRSDHAVPYVPCKGQHDLGAMEAAVLLAYERMGITPKEVHEHRAKHKPPSHD